jgi:hypothetical protein
MPARDRNGAAIRIGDPVLQRYPYRETLGKAPFRGLVTGLWVGPEGWVVEFREDGTEATRNGNAETVEYDWHPPTDKATREQRARLRESCGLSKE